MIEIKQPIFGASVLTEEDKKPKPPAPLPQREPTLIYLGVFDREEDAANAYKSARLKYHPFAPTEKSL